MPQQTCPFFIGPDQCTIARDMAEVETLVGLTEAACDHCQNQAVPPMSHNEVTVSIATLNVPDDRKEAFIKQWGFLIHQQTANERLAGIEAGTGPGSQLWKLLSSLGVTHTSDCSCVSLAEYMNAVGPARCQQESGILINRIKANQELYGWSTWLKAGALAVVTGLAFSLNPLDPIPGLFAEALKRAEQANV